MHWDIYGGKTYEFKPPDHCDKCGKPFPWTVRREATRQASIQATEARARVERQSDVKAAVARLLDRFDLVAKQLRKRRDNRPTLDVNDEYDVQDMLHALLRLYFDDIRSEEWTPSYAGKSSRMDFLVKPEQVVIETKMARQTLTHKELGDQLMVDIARYQVHPDCKELWCFIYDPRGYVSNPRGVEADLSGVRESLYVRVLIRP
jgi:hypothetical protein